MGRIRGYTETPENHGMQQKTTFEKFRGTQKFRKIMIFEKTGHPKIRPRIRSHTNAHIGSHTNAHIRIHRNAQTRSHTCKYIYVYIHICPHS